jgi:hypothetical protein
MIILLAGIAQYTLVLGGLLFVTWMTTVEVRYQNNECFLLDIEQKNSTNENISSNSSMIDSRLKLNHFTILGTHNSYHRANFLYKYGHQSLDKQLSFGIRQIELLLFQTMFNGN